MKFWSKIKEDVNKTTEFYSNFLKNLYLDNSP